MYLYKITNTKTKLIYIGQTIQSIRSRWNSHKCSSKRLNTYLYKSIRKYGIENFTIEEIGGANSLSELNYLEKLYICKYNSLAPNGYNLQEGGGNARHNKETIEKMSKKISHYFKHNKHSRSIEVYDIETGEYFPSIRGAARHVGINQALLVGYLQGKKTNPTNLRYLNKTNNYNPPTKKSCRAKEIINTETGETWPSVRKCAISVNIEHNTLRYRIKRNRGVFSYVKRPKI